MFPFSCCTHHLNTFHTSWIHQESDLTPWIHFKIASHVDSLRTGKKSSDSFANGGREHWEAGNTNFSTAIRMRWDRHHLVWEGTNRKMSTKALMLELVVDYSDIRDL
jgi:hypothetical protein